MSLLSMENVHLEYQRRGKTVQALKECSLTLEPGETVGLVGKSGSGKSSVALAILRLIRPQEGKITHGRIIFDGKDLLTLSEEEMRQIRGKDIAMVFQDPFTALNPVMTIREQMEESITAHQQHRKANIGDRVANSENRSAILDIRSAICDALSQVQLDAERMLRSYPHQLSGGQRQRICIAMALLNQPKLLIADEPTTALDVLVQKEIMDLLTQIKNNSDTALLLISHNRALISRYTHRQIQLQSC